MFSGDRRLSKVASAHTLNFITITTMARAGPSRRSRAISEEDEDGPRQEASASHLVSFLTGYDDRHPSDQEGSSDEDRQDGSDDDLEEEDEEEDMDATPTKRAKTGLVGTSTPRSARSTPKSKRTPRKAATPKELPKEGDPGFVRPTKSDAYFFAMSRSSRTSGNSYSALVKPLSQAQYERYTSKARATGKSKEEVESLQEGYSERFDQWEAELDEGFDLMVYGFGSKRRVLNRFVREKLARRGHCVVVNGHFPGTNIRDVLGNVEDSLGIPQDVPVPLSGTPLEKLANRIYGYFVPTHALSRKNSSAEAPLYLVIHNIDSPGMRSPRALGVLALLASNPRIHLVASFDHVHTPLLFPASMSHKPKHYYAKGEYKGVPQSSRGFNWIYHNVTTFDDYDVELTYQRLSASTTLGGITSSHTGGISEEGALQILKSVPPMALRLFKLLLTKQLDALPPDPTLHTAHPAAQVAPVFGIDNDTLQRLSREKFIAREEERYNALMGEFKDHGLVVEAQGDVEGRTGRWDWIPLGKAALERVLETMHEVEV